MIGIGGLVGAGTWALIREDNENAGGSRHQPSLPSWMPRQWMAFCERKGSENKTGVKSWKEMIDEQNFKTETDKVVLWTGAQAGNLTKADNYASANGRGKKILERTQPGILLNGHNLWNPEWFKEYLKSPEDQNDHSNNIFIQGLRALSLGYFHKFETASKKYATLSKEEQEKAMAIWRYASQKLADGITGHVVAFILSQDHDNYAPGSTYHHIEKPILLKNPEVFLSEIIVKKNESFLSTPQQESLRSNSQNQQLLRYFKIAKNAFNGLEAYFEYQANKDSFIRQHDELKKIDRNLFQELNSTLQGSKFSLFVQKAQALAEVWDGLKPVIEHLDEDKPAEAQEIQERLHQKMAEADGIETVSDEWKAHYEWLQEAICFLDYQIFKKYNEIGLKQSAQQWRPGDPLEETYEPLGTSSTGSRVEKKRKRELALLEANIAELKRKRSGMSGLSELFNSMPLRPSRLTTWFWPSRSILFWSWVGNGRPLRRAQSDYHLIESVSYLEKIVREKQKPSVYYNTKKLLFYQKLEKAAEEIQQEIEKLSLVDNRRFDETENESVITNRYSTFLKLEQIHQECYNAFAKDAFFDKKYDIAQKWRYVAVQQSELVSCFDKLVKATLEEKTEKTNQKKLEIYDKIKSQTNKIFEMIEEIEKQLDEETAKAVEEQAKVEEIKKANSEIEEALPKKTDPPKEEKVEKEKISTTPETAFGFFVTSILLRMLMLPR